MNLRVFLGIVAVFLSLSGTATKIAILSDIHVTPGNQCEEKLQEAVNEINGCDNLDLVVVNGDLTNEGSDEQLINVKRILDQLNLPQYVIPGNHENNWSQSATKTFADLWGNDRFVAETDSLIIVGINCGPYMKMGDGHIKQEDLHWLASTLSQKANNGKRVVSFNHYPLSDDLDNYQDYAAILENYRVLIHVNGHYHKNHPYRCGEIECMMVRSLDRKNGDFGYTVMDITPDSVLFYQKKLGEAPQRIHGVEARKTAPKHKLKDQKGSLVEGKNMTIPSGWRVTKVWTDSASVFTRVGFGEDNVFIGNSLGTAKAIDRRSGECKWKYNTGASLFSRIASASGKVVIPGADKRLVFVDVNDGHEIESRVSNGPYVADGIVEDSFLYQGGYKKFEKFDLASNELIWRYDSIGNYCQASPTLTNDKVIFGAWDTYLYCLDKNTGKLIWKWSNGKSANMLGPGNVVPIVSGEQVIIVAPDRYLSSINLNTGETNWRDNSNKYRESLGISEDRKTAYAKTMDGELVAIDLTSPAFKEAWIIDMGLGYDHAPCIVAEKDGIVWAGSRRGKLTAVDPVSKNIIFSQYLGTSEINGIDVDPHTGEIWVSLIEGTVWKVSTTSQDNPQKPK